MYGLESGDILQAFVHGLPLDGDVHPSPCTFLPMGFAFCGASVDGKVTIWDIKLGDKLQSVRHSRASVPPILPALVFIFHERVPLYMPLQYVFHYQSPTRQPSCTSSSPCRFTWKRGVVTCSLQQHRRTKLGSGARDLPNTMARAFLGYELRFGPR